VPDKPTPLFCAIDVGSHTVKLRLARRGPDNSWALARERIIITKLGHHLGRTGRLDPDGGRKSLEAIGEFLAEARGLGAQDVAMVGTMALRQAADGAQFVCQVEQATGLSLTIISGLEEARLTYLGAMSSLLCREDQSAPTLVFDIGGASTELAWGSGHAPDGRLSLAVGSISLTEFHGLQGAVTSDVVKTAMIQVSAMLADIEVAPGRLVGIGATPASLVALEQQRDLADGQEVHGQILHPESVTRWLAALAKLEEPARRQLAGLHPERAPVILGGTIIVAAMFQRWPGIEMIISSCGLRQGILADRFAE